MNSSISSNSNRNVYSYLIWAIASTLTLMTLGIYIWRAWSAVRT